MSKTLLLKIEPTILKYARKYSGLTTEQVSKKAKIALEKLEVYEEHGGDISLTHLEKFSRIYKRPLAFFLLLKVPADAVEPKEFRIVYESEEASFSPAAYLAIRRARYVQTVINELGEDKFEYKFPPISTKDDTDKLAGWFRDYLGVSLEKQHGWSNVQAALREWRAALESRGIYVLQQSIPKDHISAFSLVDKHPYILLLNSTEHESRRVFSLFHEIGHILLHKSGICSPEDLSRNSYEYVQIEKFCNQFAASFLIPKDEFANNAEVSRLVRISVDEWDDNDLRGIASGYKVSKEVVLRRFLTLGMISEESYEKRRQQWLKEAKNFKQPKKKEFKIPMYRKCLSQNGKKFTSFILDQYHANKITFSSAADMLSINAKHMSRLEANIS
ncbi:MAG: ImmA/IrrE family metallo-endopeptidase [bacterium]|nr:ImmA/IrrE family metallo-endopeptidase [bacterium]